VCKRLARDFEIGQQPLWNRKYSVYASIQHQFEPAQKKRIILFIIIAITIIIIIISSAAHLHCEKQ